MRKPAQRLFPKLRQHLRPKLPPTVGQRQIGVSLQTAPLARATPDREHGKAAKHGLTLVPPPPTASTLQQGKSSDSLPATISDEASCKSNALVLHGEYWQVTYGGRTSILEDTRGLRYIALLIRAAGTGPIYANELVAFATGNHSAAVELENKEPVMDSAAENRLVKRLEEIGFERNSASAQNNFERVAALDEEVDRISEELQGVRAPHKGHGGRAAFNNSGEKARKAVSKAISEAISKMLVLHELEPLAHHLSTSIQKGQWLSYNGNEHWHIDFHLPVAEKSRSRITSIATRKLAAAKAGTSK